MVVKEFPDKIKELLIETLEKYNELPLNQESAVINQSQYKKFDVSNYEMLEFFKNIDSPIEVLEFERWLLKI
jgi:hypothetical protein